jgi:hypothetical protein
VSEFNEERGSLDHMWAKFEALGVASNILLIHNNSNLEI